MANTKRKTEKPKVEKGRIVKIKDPIAALLGSTSHGTQEQIDWAMVRINKIVDESPLFLSRSKEEQEELHLHLGLVLYNWYAIFKLKELLEKEKMAFLYFKKNYSHKELAHNVWILNKLMEVQNIEYPPKDKS